MKVFRNPPWHDGLETITPLLAPVLSSLPPYWHEFCSPVAPSPTKHLCAPTPPAQPSIFQSHNQPNHSTTTMSREGGGENRLSSGTNVTCTGSSVV